MADFGVVAVDSKKVVVPSNETIYSFKVALTRSDQKRSQIILETTERQVTMGSDEPLDAAAWDAADAMLATVEGQAFLAALKARLESEPLKLSLTKEVLSVSPE